jgi:hypothetical protein
LDTGFDAAPGESEKWSGWNSGEWEISNLTK